ncbi:MAG: NAD-dependent malic enzyme, partial [Verrucomicrobiota bacterium]
ETKDLSVVINGAGAAGTAIAKLLRCIDQDPNVCTPVADVVICDSKGALHRSRTDLNPQKQALLEFTNRQDRNGSLFEVLQGADVFVGVSVGGLLKAEHVESMAKDAVILAMANPTPEIMPDEARRAGAAVVGTGRSDFPNQVNNVLAFPGIFRGALDAGAARITAEMKIAAARALAGTVENPTPERILPSPLDRTVAPIVAKAVVGAAL